MLGQRCHLQPLQLPPHVPLPCRAPSPSLWREPPALILQHCLAALWVLLPGLTPSSLQQVFPVCFCTESSVCPAGSSLLGQDYQCALGKSALRLLFPSVCPKTPMEKGECTHVPVNKYLPMFLSLYHTFCTIAVKNFTVWLSLKGPQLVQQSFGNSGESETRNSQMLRLGWWGW